MNRFLCGVLLLVIPCCLVSCSFHKLIKGKVAKIQTGADTSHIARPPQPDTVARVAAPVPDSMAIVRHLISDLMPLWKNRLVYNTFKGKAKVRIDGPDGKFDFTAHFRIRKDSVIWIEADAMGGLYRIRVLITRDSLTMINYAQKEVTRLPLSQAAKVLPAKVDFSSLQNLVVGEPLREGNITGAKDMDGLWGIQVEDSSYIQHITYNKTDSTMHEAELLTHDVNGPRAMSQYADYDTSGNRKIATSRILEIRHGDDVYTLDLNFLNTEFDVPQDYPFNIPEKFSVKE